MAMAGQPLKKMNKPFPSFLVPLFQNESSCKTFHIEISLICMKHFLVNGFTLRHVLIQRQKATQNCPNGNSRSRKTWSHFVVFFFHKGPLTNVRNLQRTTRSSCSAHVMMASVWLHNLCRCCDGLLRWLPRV